MMKKLVLIIVSLFMLVIVSGCGSNSTYSDTNDSCYAPTNPYNDGGGHDAGFEWARKTGGYCNGNSNSFNEGCEEYYYQLEQYNDCL